MTSMALIWDLIAIDNASPAFRKVGAEAEGASGMVRGLAVSLGATALGAALGYSVKQAAEFQSKMVMVGNLAGNAGKSVAGMSKQVMELAQQTGQSSQEMADALYHFASVNLYGTDALNALAIAAKGAKIGHADLVDTTNSLTSAIASGIAPGESYSQMMSSLLTIVGTGDMTMAQLNDSLSNGVLQTMPQYGVSLKEVGAGLAAFGDGNIRGQNAATQLRMAVQSFFKVMQGGDSILGKYGLSQKELIQDLHDGGLTKALDDMHQKFQAAGVQTKDLGAIITQVFGRRAGVGLAVLLQEYDRYHMKLDDITNAAQTFGDKWDTVTKTASFKFDQLKSTLENVAISLGTKLMGPLGDLASWIANTGIPKLGEFGSALGNAVHSDVVQTAVTTIKQLFGDAEVAAGRVVDKAKELWTSLKDSSAVDHLKTIIGDLGTGLHGVIMSLADWTRGFLDVAKVVGEVALPVLGLLASVLGTVAKWIGALPGPIRDVVLGLAALKIATSIDLFGRMAGSSNMLVRSLGKTGGAFGTFAGTYRQAMTAVDETSALALTRTEALGAAFQATFPRMTNAVNAAADGVRASMARIGAAAVEAADTVRLSMMTMLGTTNVTHPIPQMVGDVAGAMAGLKQAAVEVGSVGMRAITTGATGVVNFLGGPFGTALTAATIGIALFDSAQQQATTTENKWLDALKAGGVAARQAAADMTHGQMSFSQSAVLGAAGATSWGQALGRWMGVLPDPQKTKDQFQSWYHGLDQVGRAQEDLTLATAHYNDVADQYGANSRQAIAAAAEMQQANELLTSTQNDVNQATKTHLQLLQEQSNLELTKINSQLAAEQAQGQLDSAMAQYNIDLGKGKANTGAFKQELNSLTSQAIAYAQTQAQAAADADKANGKTDTSITYANTLHDTLQKLADEAKGPLKAALQQAADATSGATVKVSDFNDITSKLGLNIAAVWPDGTKVVAQATKDQIQHLQELGYNVTILPGQDRNKPVTIYVSANTDQAEGKLSQLAADAKRLGWLGAVFNGVNNVGIGSPVGGNNGGLPPGLVPIPPHATGGLLRGAGTGTSDSLLARVSNGEFIVNAKATAANLPLLTAMNSGVRAFASGGQVGGGGWLMPGMKVAMSGNSASQQGAALQQQLGGGPIEITGTLEIGGDGLARIVDGRIVQFAQATTARGRYSS